jgi:cytochrome c5
MKKYLIATVGICAAAVVLFSNCHSSKKAAASSSNVVTAPAVSYAVNVKSIVETHCSPCHVPSKGGNKKNLDNYDTLKASIDDVLRRIQLNPTDRGFMPFKNPKLSDSTIAVFKQWHDTGMSQ